MFDLCGVCFSIVALSATGFAGLLYSLHVPVPPGLVRRPQRWLMFVIIRAMDRVGTLLEWLGVNDRLMFMKSTRGMKPPPVETHLYTDVQTEDTSFDGVSVRIFTPNNRSTRAGIVHIHGGGWCACSVDIYEELCRKIAFDTETLVVSIDYRLAPEHPFPIPFDDCLIATKHFLRHTDQYGVDPQTIAIMGDSAGANLAAAVSLALRDEDFSPVLKAQVLIYPVTQSLNFNLPSYQQNANGPILTRGWMAGFTAQYALGHQGANYDVTDKIARTKHVTSDVIKKMSDSKLSLKYLPNECLQLKTKPLDVSDGDVNLWNKIKDSVLDQRFSPLLADDLSSLPAAFVFTGQYDVLRDEGIMYARRLQEAGNDVTWRHSNSGFHGMIDPASIRDQPDSRKTYNEIINFLKMKLL